MLPHLAAGQPVAGSFTALETSQPWLPASTSHRGLGAGVHSSELRDLGLQRASQTIHPIRCPHFPDGEIGPAGSCQGQDLNPAPVAGWALLGSGRHGKETRKSQPDSSASGAFLSLLEFASLTPLLKMGDDLKTPLRKAGPGNPPAGLSGQRAMHTPRLSTQGSLS